MKDNIFINMKLSQLKHIIKEEIYKAVNELQANTLKQINDYIDDTHWMEPGVLDDFPELVSMGADFIINLRDTVNLFLECPEGSEEEELFGDSIIWHLKTAGKGFTDQQIKEYMQLLKLRRNKEQIGGVKLSELYVATKKSKLKHFIKEEITKILSENAYLDQLLDKISSSGIDSLSDAEKNDLNRYSKGEDPTPKKFKVRLEKNSEFGGVYDSYLYKEDNRWIPEYIFEKINSLFMGTPDNPDRAPIYLNTYPKPDSESNMTHFKDLNTKDPNGARLQGDKEGEILKFFKDEGNMNDLTQGSQLNKIIIPGKYIDILKF